MITEYNIKQLKLVTGDEVICQIQKDDDQYYDDFILEAYYALLVTPMIWGGTGEAGEKMSYMLTPWMLYQSDFATPVEIQYNGIVAIFTPDKNIQTQYLRTIQEINAQLEKFNKERDSDGKKVNKIKIEEGHEDSTNNVFKFTPRSDPT